MKRIFSLLSLTLSMLSLAHSQDMTTLTQEGRQWSTHVWWAVSPPQDYTEVYRMEGDTTLGGKTYKKIYCYHKQDLSDRTLYTYACRQEDKKVFIRFYGEKSEKLFFDFSFNVGDTLFVEEHSRKMRVTAIGDTIINGRASRYVRLVNEYEYGWHEEDIWVEGIGSLDYGIVWNGMRHMTGAKKYTLLCCHQGNDLLWKKSDTETCFVGDLSVEPTWILNSAQWQLSPQPAGETVQAICTSSDAMWQKGRWFLHDLSGRRLQSSAFTDGRFEVTLSSVPQGMYMIEILAAQGNGICRLKCVKGR